jgi:hypothetical protein
VYKTDLLARNIISDREFKTLKYIGILIESDFKIRKKVSGVHFIKQCLICPAVVYKWGLREDTSETF